MIYGLVAAVGFGLADFLTAIAARRLGALLTLVVVQVVGTLMVTAFFVVAGPSTGAAAGGVWVGLIVAGGVTALAYFGLYRGLELGPVAIVSPVVAANAAIAILLVVPVLHERVSGPAWIGVVAALAGVVLASTDPRGVGAALRADRRGIAWALVAMVIFGVAVFISGWAAKRFGWFLPMFCSRLGTMAALAAVVGATGGRTIQRPGPSARFLWLAAVVGVVDLGGFAAFTRGSQVGLVSIVIAVSATFPLIPMAGGMLAFGERPAPTQLLGAALVVVGLFVLGVAS